MTKTETKRKVLLQLVEGNGDLDVFVGLFLIENSPGVLGLTKLPANAKTFDSFHDAFHYMIANEDLPGIFTPYVYLEEVSIS